MPFRLTVLALRVENELALTSTLCTISAAIPPVTSRPEWHDVATLSSMRLASNVAIVAGMLVELLDAASTILPSASSATVTLLPPINLRSVDPLISVDPDPTLLSSVFCFSAKKSRFVFYYSTDLYLQFQADLADLLDLLALGSHLIFDPSARAQKEFVHVYCQPVY